MYPGSTFEEMLPGQLNLFCLQFFCDYRCFYYTSVVFVSINSYCDVCSSTLFSNRVHFFNNLNFEVNYYAVTLYERKKNKLFRDIFLL